jgi:serine protease AprX
MSENTENLIHAEAILVSKFGSYFMNPNATFIESSVEFEDYKAADSTIDAAKKGLTAIGFKVVASSPFALSIVGSKELFEKVFSTKIKRALPILELEKPTQIYYSERATIPSFSFAQKPSIPKELENEVQTVFLPPFIKFLGFPPTSNRLPQNPMDSINGYYPPQYLTPRDLCKSELLNGTNLSVSGNGITVAMLDTGLDWSHQYYQSSNGSYHGGTYNHPSIYESDGTLAVGSAMYQDDHGHGTAMASNLLAVAPDCKFLFVKTSRETAFEAFKNTRDKLSPDVMSCSWYVDLVGNPSSIADTIKLWDAEISLATKTTIVFACGNLKQEPDYPSCSKYVISVGGTWPVYDSKGSFLKLSATEYATSGKNKNYPKRRCPDISGICGPKPSGWMIMMPTHPNSYLDKEFSSSPLNSSDGTGPGDGWIVGSGTSAATAQVAGVVALLLQKHPGLTPSQVLSVLKSSANNNIKDGKSCSGEKPSQGACGSGLVDINKALI